MKIVRIAGIVLFSLILFMKVEQFFLYNDPLIFMTPLAFISIIGVIALIVWRPKGKK